MNGFVLFLLASLGFAILWGAITLALPGPRHRYLRTWRFIEWMYDFTRLKIAGAVTALLLAMVIANAMDLLQFGRWPTYVLSAFWTLALVPFCILSAAAYKGAIIRGHSN